MCDHRNKKTIATIFHGYYMCECGAILNVLRDNEVLTPDELTQLIRDLFNKKMATALSLLNGAMKL